MAAISKVLARVQRNWNPVHLVGPAAENHVEVPQKISTTPQDPAVLLRDPQQNREQRPRQVCAQQPRGGSNSAVRPQMPSKSV